MSVIVKISEILDDLEKIAKFKHKKPVKKEPYYEEEKLPALTKEDEALIDRFLDVMKNPEKYSPEER